MKAGLHDLSVPAGRYGRYSNPTWIGVENRLTELSGADASLVFASGMAAHTTAFLALLKASDEVVLPSEPYRQVRNVFHHVLPKFGVTVHEFSIREPEEFIDNVRSLKGRLKLRPPGDAVLTAHVPHRRRPCTSGPRPRCDRHPRQLLLASPELLCPPVGRRPSPLQCDQVPQRARRHCRGRRVGPTGPHRQTALVRCLRRSAGRTPHPGIRRPLPHWDPAPDPRLQARGAGHHGAPPIHRLIAGTLADVLLGRCVPDSGRAVVFSPFGLGVPWATACTPVPGFFGETSRW